LWNGSIFLLKIIKKKLADIKIKPIFEYPKTKKI